MDRTIEKWRAKLEEAQVRGLAEFIDKIHSQREPENLESLLCEARAALMFQENGFRVSMQDRPDLALEVAGIRLYAEVKHFRMKEQNKIDEERLLEAGGQALEDDLSVLVPYGDTRETEGGSAQQQLVDVARKKIDQYHKDAPNILVIFSSSPHCVEDADFEGAAHEIDDDIAARRIPGLERLSALMLVTETWRKWPNGCCVYFDPLQNSATPLPKGIMEALSAIKHCKWKL
jgi:hypothetical protein